LSVDILLVVSCADINISDTLQTYDHSDDMNKLYFIYRTMQNNFETAYDSTSWNGVNCYMMRMRWD